MNGVPTTNLYVTRHGRDAYIVEGNDIEAFAADGDELLDFLDTMEADAPFITLHDNTGRSFAYRSARHQDFCAEVEQGIQRNAS